MGSKEHQFSDNYLILKAENASLLDLFLFLLPFGFRKRKFVDCPEGKEESYTSFADRFLIFISMLLQKLLILLATPLQMLNDFLEKLVNLTTFNGGILGVIWKVVRGVPLVQPDVKSPEYATVLGASDRRRDLDKSIKPEDTFRYYGGLTIMAAKVAYESLPVVQAAVNDRWKMKLLGYYDFWNDFQGKATTQAFTFQNTAADPNLTVVAFRGTSPLDAYDWQVDADFSWFEIKGIGRIHSGFMKALGLQKITGWPKELIPIPLLPTRDFAYYYLRQKLRDIIKKNDKARFIVTGHSLGGALAILFVTILGFHNESSLLEKLDAVYTYGQPRVGDQQWAEFMVSTKQKYGFKYHRYVYSNDLVPRIPGDGIIFKYKHFGGCLYFNSLYRGRVLKEQPNKNYFSVLWLIPKYLVAWWELIRSFIFPLWKGSDYTENWVLKGLRVVGLFIPGVTAHLPTDYVNSTRLGKLRVSEEIEDPFLADCIESDY